MQPNQSIIGAALASVLFYFAAAEAQDVPDADVGPWLFDASGVQLRVVTIAQGLVHPWSLTFLPNGDLLVAESNGYLRLIRDDQLVPEPVWTSPAAGSGDGLKSVAVHPEFADNGLVYAAYPKSDGERGNTLAMRAAGSSMRNSSTSRRSSSRTHGSRAATSAAGSCSVPTTRST